MSSLVRTHRYTFDDFCFLVNEDKKADLIDGVIYMASPENTEANQLFFWICMLIAWFSETLDLGKVYCLRVALRLDNHNGPEPDILFVRESRSHVIKKGYIAGPADLTVEIVSPDSIERDYVDKRRLYEKAGVPEYWIVDPLKEIVTLLRLDAKGNIGRYRRKKASFTARRSPASGFARSGSGKPRDQRKTRFWWKSLHVRIILVDLRPRLVSPQRKSRFPSPRLQPSIQENP
jgi:Uma2 family endonuclease